MERHGKNSWATAKTVVIRSEEVKRGDCLIYESLKSFGGLGKGSLGSRAVGSKGSHLLDQS